MKCPICETNTERAFTTTVLSKYEAEYRYCRNCGYLFAADPHWLNEAYTDAISSTDTGLVKRNISIGSKVACLLYFFAKERGKGRYLDVAGGYGMLTRMMRDFGFDFFWQDKYCANLLAKGFEFNRTDGDCLAATAFEVLEHVTKPIDFIKLSLEEAGASTLIFSTILYKGEPPDPRDWWYYAFSTGQHIGFFQKRTLEFIGQKLGLRFSTANDIHILSKTKFSYPFMKILTRDIFSRMLCFWVQFRLKGKAESDREILLARQ
jgi:hypothetical protein